METRNAPTKPSRFQIVKLEERIAPAAFALATALAIGPNVANTQTYATGRDYGAGGNLSYAASYAYGN